MSKYLDELSIRQSKSREKQDHPISNKASYTDEAFYKKMNAYKNIPNTYLSPKQSIYEQFGQPSAQNTKGDLDYNTLNPIKNPSLSMSHGQQEEFERVVEFQLNREREKNKILEERLKNKEVFINKMKQVQDQLSAAFQKCQEDLRYYRTFYESHAAADLRDYIEQISELKHLLIRMEDEIQYLKKNQNRHFNSVKEEILIEDEDRDLSKQNSNQKIIKHSKRSNAAQPKGSEIIKKQKRSKTLMNNQQSSPEFKSFNVVEEYIIKYSSRISNFVSQFLAMVECFSQEAVEAKKDKSCANIKRRLKIGWKWIKEVVVEWNSLKNTINKYEKFIKKLKRMSRVGDEFTLQESFEKIFQSLQK